MKRAASRSAFASSTPTSDRKTESTCGQYRSSSHSRFFATCSAMVFVRRMPPEQRQFSECQFANVDRRATSVEPQRERVKAKKAGNRRGRSAFLLCGQQAGDDC